MSYPTANLAFGEDTKAHVVSIYKDKGHYACAHCSAVVVSTRALSPKLPTTN